MPDVQGTRFHLLRTQQDWERCELPDGSTVGDALHASPPGTCPVQPGDGSLRLTRLGVLFRLASGVAPRPVEQRRGADRSSSGTWFWIGPDRTTIRFRHPDAGASELWWSVEALQDPVSGCNDSRFRPGGPPRPVPLQLAGLAVIRRQQLVVGWQSADGTAFHGADAGLLVFDLEAGGPPLPIVLAWPEPGFRPWDFAAEPDGGLLVLDRWSRRYWRVDRHLRVAGTTLPSPPQAFRNPTQVDCPIGPAPVSAPGRTLAGGPLPPDVDPVAIEPGPDGAVVVLDNPDRLPWSRLIVLDGHDEPVSVSPLRDVLLVGDPLDEDAPPVPYSLRGYDLTVAWPARYADSPGAAPAPDAVAVVSVVDIGGKQSIRLTWPVDSFGAPPPAAQPDYLPMRRFVGKGLVDTPDGPFYDFADRWVPLAPLAECRFERLAVLTTPTGYSTDAVPGQPLDSTIPGCVWHRVLIDASIPPGTALTVRFRAADDPDLLDSTSWVAQPDPYLRPAGAELPWYDPWRGTDPTERNRRGAGTWELLIQGSTGRYGQLELTLTGNGRSSPEIEALRVWYPRFSYLRSYLPDVYQLDPVSADFLDRFLANPEGMLTGLEQHIETSAILLDPAAAPAETLDWLASFLGLLLDPQWSVPQRRFLLQHAPRLFQRRGTVAGLETMLRIFLTPDPDETVFAPEATSSARVRVLEGFRTRARADVLAAHRFDVLLPQRLADEEARMIERIVEVEKPAHTAADLRRYFELFRVGLARLGLDTQIAERPSWPVLVLGGATLAGTLGARYPFDVPDRAVVDRNRVGDYPAL